MITRTTLPPVQGYVEVEVDGKRCYKNVDSGVIYGPNDVLPKTKSVYELTEENRILKEKVAALSDRDDFMEECLVEVSGIVYQ